jgi:hypothetical protein
MAVANKVVQPSPRSLYRKIQRVLSEARKGKARSLDDLRSQIDKAGHLDFTRYAVLKGKTTVVPCSVDTIGRVVDMCVTLKLLTDGAALTQRGATAARTERFDEAMRLALESRLGEIGAPLATVRTVVRNMLSSGNHDSLPTWDQILRRLDNAPRRQEFKNLLGLLAACGGIATCRRKIYLPQ